MKGFDDPTTSGDSRRSFRYQDTQALYETGKSERLGALARVATRKLISLDAATTLEVLEITPGQSAAGSRQ